MIYLCQVHLQEVVHGLIQNQNTMNIFKISLPLICDILLHRKTHMSRMVMKQQSNESLIVIVCYLTLHLKSCDHKNLISSLCGMTFGWVSRERDGSVAYEHTLHPLKIKNWTHLWLGPIHLKPPGDAFHCQVKITCDKKKSTFSKLHYQNESKNLSISFHE